MDFKKFYIIPDRNNIAPYIELSKKYGFHFEYNDFFMPFNLDTSGYVDEVIDFYKATKDMPEGNTLHGSFLDVTIFSRDLAIKKISENRLRESMQIAERIGAKAVIIHTNFIPNFRDDNYENYWIEANATFIKELLNEFPKLSIYMENMFDEEPRLLAMLAKELKNEKRFGVCFDYAHANVFGKCRIEDWFESLTPYIKHIHINDNDLIKDSHMALGQGKIDYVKFFDYYEKNLSDVSVLLEMNGIDKLKMSIEFIKKCH